MQAGGGANIMLGAIVGASLPAGPGGQARARPNDKHGRRRSWTNQISASSISPESVRPRPAQHIFRIYCTVV